MAWSSISGEGSDRYEIIRHDICTNPEISLADNPRKWKCNMGYRNVTGIHLCIMPCYPDIKWHQLCSFSSFFLLSGLDWTIHCQCICYLILLIFGREFICPLCWQANRCGAICLRCGFSLLSFLPFMRDLLGGHLREGYTGCKDT